MSELYTIRTVGDNSLHHYGVLGMHWGVRRYQRRDGTLTRAGQKKAEKLRRKYVKVTGRQIETLHSTVRKRKPVSEMTDDELRKAVNRLQLEKQYSELVSKQNSTKSAGMKFLNRANKLFNESIDNAVKSTMTSEFNKAIKKFII